MSLTVAPAPSYADILAARKVLHDARLARTRALRKARRVLLPRRPIVFPQAEYRCANCGDMFMARVFARPSIGRWCSASCRQLAYFRRKTMAARRAEKNGP